MNTLASPLFTSPATVTAVLVAVAGPTDSMPFGMVVIVITLATFFIVIRLMKRVVNLASHLLESTATAVVGLFAFFSVGITILLTAVVLVFTYR